MENYRLMGNKVIYDEPFLPGEKQLDYSYQLAIPDSGNCAIAFKINYPADEFHIMVGDEGCEATSTELLAEEPIIAGDGQYFVHLMGENSARGTIIDVNLSNLARGGVPVVIVLVIIITVIAGIAVYLIIRKIIKKKPRLTTAKAIGSEGDIEAQRRRLQQELAQLGDDFKQGLISEDIFNQLHSEKETHLKGLKVQKEGESAADG